MSNVPSAAQEHQKARDCRTIPRKEAARGVFGTYLQLNELWDEFRVVRHVCVHDNYERASSMLDPVDIRRAKPEF